MTTLDHTTRTAPITPTVDLLAMANATVEHPRTTPLPKDVRAAWNRLPGVNGTVRTPTPASPWTPADYAAAESALDTARTLMAHLRLIEKTVTDGFLTDLDQLAYARAEADPAFAALVEAAPRDGHGHLVLGAKGRPMQVPLPGGRVLSAEYSTGAPTLTVQDLQELHRAKKIPGRVYRKLVKQVTVIDTEALTQALGRDPGLADRLRGAWRTGRTTINVHLRHPKTV